MFVIAVSVAVFAIGAAGQTVTCATGASTGPCSLGPCPDPTNVCLPLNGELSCCPADNLTAICPTTAPATTRSTTTCVDLLNPVTGVSDCPKRAYLCNDSTYYTIMTQQCPKTCGRCTSSGSTTCVDKVNPTTGVSDCPNRVSYCTNAAYKTLMQQQCPKTCGFC